MEVHHSHGLTHKKSWKEYVLEFLMLFLAVTLGFFAENIREHRAEQKHIQELGEAIASDMVKDKALIWFHKGVNEKRLVQIDSLDALLAVPFGQIDQRQYYRLLTAVPVNYAFSSNDRSRKEADSKGYLQLTEHLVLNDLITHYDFYYSEVVRTQRSELDNAAHLKNDILPGLVDPDVYAKAWRFPASELPVATGIKPISAEAVAKLKLCLADFRFTIDSYRSAYDSMSVYADRIHREIEPE